MPRIKSVERAMRGSRRKQIYNLRTKKKFREAVKAVRQAIIKKDGKTALEKLSAAYRQLDMAAKKHTIHKNKAARLKSRLAAAINKLEQTVKPAASSAPAEKAPKKTKPVVREVKSAKTKAAKTPKVTKK